MNVWSKRAFWAAMSAPICLAVGIFVYLYTKLAFLPVAISVGALFLIFNMIMNARILDVAFEAKEVPVQTVRGIKIFNNYAPEWLAKRYVQTLTVDVERPELSETSMRFVARFQWFKAVIDTALSALFTLTFAWLALNRPWQAEIKRFAQDHPKTALLIFGSIATFSYALAYKKKVGQRLKRKWVLVPVMVGIILLWIALDTPGLQLLVDTIGPKHSTLLWKILTAIGAVRFLWKLSDWVYTVIILTLTRLIIAKRGPWFMPKKHVEIPLVKIDSFELDESFIGSVVRVAGAKTNTPGEGDVKFNDIWPLQYGPHHRLNREVNVLLQRRNRPPSEPRRDNPVIRPDDQPAPATRPPSAWNHPNLQRDVPEEQYPDPIWVQQPYEPPN